MRVPVLCPDLLLTLVLLQKTPRMDSDGIVQAPALHVTKFKWVCSPTDPMSVEVSVQKIEMLSSVVQKISAAALVLVVYHWVVIGS